MDVQKQEGLCHFFNGYTHVLDLLFEHVEDIEAEEQGKAQGEKHVGEPWHLGVQPSIHCEEDVDEKTKYPDNDAQDCLDLQRIQPKSV